jgi:large subunit ribosomal protein L6
MSRIGKKPIELPSGVKAEQKGCNIEVAGPLGKLQLVCKPQIKIKLEDSSLIVESKGGQSRQAGELHGTARALIANMVAGVSKGFEKKMQIFGTGYSVKTQADKLVLQVGFSHPVQLKIPAGIKVNIEVAATRGNDVPVIFTLSGIDKCALGRFAADVRKVKPPEPYQGKGIRYADEHIRRKVGKAFTSGTV